MKSNRHLGSLSLFFCMIALALPACGGGNAAPATSASAAALTNKLDDDQDGRIDEVDEGIDEDADEKIDEAHEHEDACAAHGHGGKRAEHQDLGKADAGLESDDAFETDEATDDAIETDEATDDAIETDEATDHASEESDGRRDHGDFHLDCSDMQEDAPTGGDADAGASDSTET